MNRKPMTALLSTLGILVLILDSRTALHAASEAVRACLVTVVPSLLPFFVLSVLLTASLTGARIRFLGPIGRLCRMPTGSEPLFLLGLLGGYPAGAQAVTQAHRSGQLSATDAIRLLGFCSNAGPAFLFGITGAAFSARWMPWALWGIHILSAVLTGAILPGSAQNSAVLSKGKPVTFSQAVERSVLLLARICAWIVLFRILLAFCSRWFLWLLPVPGQIAFSGVLELANGCLQLSQIDNVSMRFVIASAILAFGGLSVAMQTLSVTAGLGLGAYLPGKLLQAVLSILLSLSVFRPYFLIPTALFTAFPLIFRKIKKSSGNSRKVIV